jgi:hypothetical protein
MNTVTVIIITALINVVVTSVIGGIIVYLIQKKIDASIFRNQTKFMRSHEKMVETLENLYKYYVEFRDVCIRLMEKKYYDVDEKTLTDKDDLVQDKLKTISNYHRKNDIYLNSHDAKIVARIIFKSLIILTLIEGIANDYSSAPDIFIETFNRFIANSISPENGFDLSNINTTKASAEQYLSELTNEIDKILNSLGELYKSASNVK